MSAQTVLHGIAWNHSRALPPLVATAQRFEELHPDVAIHWEKRSLHDFGHAGLVSLASRFDLLVIDHPMMGVAFESGALHNLQALFPRSFLDDVASDSVGQSYESYQYEGALFAIPIDAAAPAASFRPDLLERAGIEAPRTWKELLDLARKKLVLMPGFHVDVFLTFMGLYVSHGGELPATPQECFVREIGRRSLEELAELASYMPDAIYELNPIAIYERLAADDQYAYCPFAYTYSNYARAGFGTHRLRFSNPVTLDDAHSLRTVLGGTGMALSSRCAATAPAIEYMTEAAGAAWQRTLYGLCGGQPARRSAWQDETLNRITNGFFEQTLASVEHAYLRPRYDGYIQFQASAGAPIVSYLREGGNAGTVVEGLNALYRRSTASARSAPPHRTSVLPTAT